MILRGEQKRVAPATTAARTRARRRWDITGLASELIVMSPAKDSTVMCADPPPIVNEKCLVVPAPPVLYPGLSVTGKSLSSSPLKVVTETCALALPPGDRQLDVAGVGREFVLTVRVDRPGVGDVAARQVPAADDLGQGVQDRDAATHRRSAPRFHGCPR